MTSRDNPAGFDQPTDANAGLVGIVLDQREVVLALGQQLVEQGKGGARRTKTADHHGRALGNSGDSLFNRLELLREPRHNCDCLW